MLAVVSRSSAVSEVRIAAETRTEFGKGPARRTRAAGKVPAVLYGHGDKPRHFALPGHELMLALKHDSNALLALQTEEGEQLALPKVVVRDPIRRTLEHVDLVAVRRGEKVTVDVPLHLTGEAASSDVLVDQQKTTISVEAEATHLPTGFELSIEGLKAGDTLHASDISLPAGVTLAESAEDVVVQGLAAPTAEAVEAELDAAAAELAPEAAAEETPAEDTDEAAADEAPASEE
jgi:large subunit ribosomal protein L25